MPKSSQIDRKVIDQLPPERKAMVNRLRRVEGQLRGIQKMIIDDKPCQDILIQLSAARKAMQQGCIEILKNYVHKCLAEQGKADFEDMEKIIGTLIDIAPIPPGPVSPAEFDEEDYEA